MINYYYVAYFLAFICVVLIVFSFYFFEKEKYEDHVFVTATLAVLCMFFSYGAYSHQEETDKNMSLGRYYSEQCKLIEGNIDNGFFSSNTNRLSCNGSILNVTVSDYDKAIETYLSKTNKSKQC
ncbi:hypothetical protein [Providencia huashanensis]